jgi:hypothetical protein
MNKYIKYKNTNYVLLEDGRPARLLKPTNIHKQEYYNFIIEGKQRRVSLGTLRKIVSGEAVAEKA